MRSGQYFLMFFLMIISCLIFPLPVSAEVEVSTTELKNRFFQSLTREQKIELMEGLDQFQQLTSFELGAKYKWGKIPPDRQPPFHLARWWKNKSATQRTQQRLRWFRNNYQKIDLDQAVRELGLRDRLTKMYRKLAAERSGSKNQLESIPFPGTTVTFGGDTGDFEGELVFRQSGPDDQASESGQDDEVSQEEAAKTKPSKDTKKGKSRGTMPDPNWSRKVRYGDQIITYKRVKGEIKFSRRKADTGPVAVEIPSFDESDDTIKKRKQFDLNILMIPQPLLRRNQK